MTLDWSQLLLQIINFLVLIWLLQRYLYRPVLAAIDRRRDERQVLDSKAAEAAARAAAAEHDWLARTRQLEAEADRQRREAVLEGQRRGEDLAAEGRRQAERLLSEAGEAVAGERRAAAGELQRHAAGLASALAARLLEAVAPGTGAAPFLAILQDRLGRLEAAETDLLAAAEARLEVAPPLSPAEQEDWRHRLAPYVAGLVFVDAPQLIAGARLSAPGVEVEASWAEALLKVRNEMVLHGQTD